MHRIVIAATSLAMVCAGVGAVESPSAVAADASIEHRGDAAINVLGDDLDDTAARLGLSAAELAEELRTDPSLWVDSARRLGVSESPLPPAQPQPRDGEPQQGASTPYYDTAKMFVLHTRPSSNRTIYLDFNGHTTSGTAWNDRYTGGRAFTSQPFDMDGAPRTFSSAEHAAIQRVWLRVREDFAPFNVDVLTEDPGVEALRKTSDDDLTFGTRVVVSPTNFPKCECGGMAYPGSFGWNPETPAFVFTHTSTWEKFIGEAASHEAGHTLGLLHDGHVLSTGVVSGSLNSTPNSGFTIEVFRRTGSAVSVLVGTAYVTADANGNAAISLTVSGLAANDTVFATATSAGGDTSELSPTVTAA